MLCVMYVCCCVVDVWVFECKQVVLLQEAKSNLLAEVERLNDRLNQTDVLDDPK